MWTKQFQLCKPSLNPTWYQSVLREWFLIKNKILKAQRPQIAKKNPVQRKIQQFTGQGILFVIFVLLRETNTSSKLAVLVLMYRNTSNLFITCSYWAKRVCLSNSLVSVLAPSEIVFCSYRINKAMITETYNKVCCLLPELY